MIVDRDFGHWFVGLIDGEGCFRIHKERGGSYYACHFQIKLRADDLPVLKMIERKLGFGSIKFDTTRNGNSQPAAIFIIQNRAECTQLAEVLDKFPLRAKKAKEYQIWRRALVWWINSKRGNRWEGHRDWSGMILYYEQMKEVRQYKPPANTRGLRGGDAKIT